MLRIINNAKTDHWHVFSQYKKSCQCESFVKNLKTTYNGNTIFLEYKKNMHNKLDQIYGNSLWLKKKDHDSKLLISNFNLFWIQDEIIIITVHWDLLKKCTIKS